MKKAFGLVALLVLASATPGMSQEDECDNCQEGCPLGHDGLWITSSGSGDEILSFGFGENRCLYDEETLCDALIPCIPQQQLNDMVLALGKLGDEAHIVAYMTTKGADFKLLRERNAVVIFGCKDSILAVIPTTATITETYVFRPRQLTRAVTALIQAAI